MKNKIQYPLALFLFISLLSFSQPDFYSKYTFTEADTIRGMLLPTRACYDVTHYHLNIKIDPEQKSIVGYVDMQFEVLTPFLTLQFDLYDNMEIDSLVWLENTSQAILHKRRFNGVFANFGDLVPRDTKQTLRIYYHGIPQVAKNAPWDGGFVWSKDQNNQHWIGVACEGDGASLWWPNKDHLSDEPDSMLISVAVPSDLMCIANGNLLRKENLENTGFTRYDWAVTYPINNYNVTVNIADYTHIKDTYEAKDGSPLLLDYYVLSYNKKIATKHFEQVPLVLEAFEHYFGKYPFWNDGYALVETPYLGMEHQGAIAYGNKYMRGYLGGMIPSDMDFDYIIVHETGHEYFGNSISCNDLAEMWLHESFTTYMESMYVEYVHGYEAAIRYMAGQKPYIRNQLPILGPMDVNWEDWGNSDHYYKGAWVLHTLRHALNNDVLFFDLMKSFHQENKRSNVTTQAFVNHVNQCSKIDYSPFFEQYLKYKDVPTLEYKLKKRGKSLQISYRWKADVADFNMPIALGKAGDYKMVYPSTQWQKTKIKGLNKADFKIATELFLVKTLEVKN